MSKGNTQSTVVRRYSFHKKICRWRTPQRRKA